MGERLWNTESQIKELFDSYYKTIDYKKISISQLNHHSQTWPTKLTTNEKEQIAAVALWNSIRKYRRGQGTKFTTYFIGQIRFEYMNYLNRYEDGKGQLNYVSDCDNLFPSDHSCEGVDIDDLLAKLPKRLETVVRMRYYENRTLKDIGRRMHVTVERVRQLVIEGLQEMRENAQGTNS